MLGKITAPTLLVQGTKDTFPPVEDSRAAAPLLTAEQQLVEIEGSQHGFAVHDDPQYLNPQRQAWQALVLETIAEWITGARKHGFLQCQRTWAAAPGASARTTSPRSLMVRSELVSHAAVTTARPTAAASSGSPDTAKATNR